MTLRKRILIILASVIMLFIMITIAIPFTFYIYGNYRVYKDAPDLPPNTVPYANSNETIYYDFTIDVDQNIHLVWQSVENGLSYQNSADSGHTWSPPIIISEESNYKISVHPTILAIGSNIVIFWMSNSLQHCLSTDNGNTWTSYSQPFRGGTHNLFNYASDIFNFYKISGQYLFVKSTDLGYSWSSSIAITPEILNVKRLKRYSISIDSSNVHMAVPFGKDLLYSRTSIADMDWSSFDHIRLKSASRSIYDNSSIDNIRLASNDKYILMTFRNKYLRYITSDDNALSWSEETDLRTYISGDYDLCANAGTFYIFTITGIHMKKDWWSYIPFHFIFTWDASPEWYNTDLYCTILSNSKKVSHKRLTQPLSRVDLHRNAIISKIIGDDIIVFWSGKEVVSKGTDKPEPSSGLFYRIIK